MRLVILIYSYLGAVSQFMQLFVLIKSSYIQFMSYYHKQGHLATTVGKDSEIFS